MLNDLVHLCAGPYVRAFAYPLLARLAANPLDHEQRLIFERAGMDLVDSGTEEAWELLEVVVRLVTHHRVPPAQLLVDVLTSLECPA